MKTSYPKAKIRVVLLENIHPRAEELLAAEGFKVERAAKALEGAKLIEMAKDAHVLGIRSHTLVRAEILAACPRLLSVVCFCSGSK